MRGQFGQITPARQHRPCIYFSNAIILQPVSIAPYVLIQQVSNTIILQPVSIAIGINTAGQQRNNFTAGQHRYYSAGQQRNTLAQHRRTAGQHRTLGVATPGSCDPWE